MAPTVTEGEVAGWRALRLQNDAVALTVLPEKGAEIHAFEDLASGVDVLFASPWGLQPPGAPPREGSGGAGFLENYGGGWQELFPNTNDACEEGGVELPFHGEVALLPWSWEIERQDADELAVRFEVSCLLSPFRLARTMRLAAGGRRLVLDETVTNRSGQPARFVWGHHCVLGAPLVAPGARLHASARTIVTIPELWEQTARLEPGQRTAWPMARLRAGGDVDLSYVPGEDVESHDDVYLTDLDAGRAEVLNGDLGLGFRLTWDAAVFRWIISWQPYGGARELPLRGSYALGVEPWTGGGNLASAVAAGEALTLAGGASLSTTLVAEIIAA